MSPRAPAPAGRTATLAPPSTTRPLDLGAVPPPRPPPTRPLDLGAVPPPRPPPTRPLDLGAVPPPRPPSTRPLDLGAVPRPPSTRPPTGSGAGPPPPGPSRPFRVAGARLGPGPGAPALVAAGARRAALAGLVPVRETPAGPLHLAETAGAAWPELDGPSAAAVACASGPLDLRCPLFLDTETTGLAGGTGTLPFLVGVAVEREGRVLVEQAHLEAPGRERAVLAWLTAHLARATALVTFNGKSFDWPLLRSRFVMNRLPVPPLPPHLDLLHCARRVFRHDLEQHTLTALERLALGVERQGDLPGALIPAVWFDYLRSGRVGGLQRVLEHNHRDVVSMVELLACLLEAWQGRRPVSAGARLALARLAVDRGDDPRALAFLEAGAPADAALAAEALELRGGILKRRGALPEAAVALEAALGAHRRPSRLRLALARLYERQLKDFEAARAHAVHAEAAEPADRHRRRLERLDRRARGAAPGPPLLELEAAGEGPGRRPPGAGQDATAPAPAGAAGGAFELSGRPEGP